MKRSGRNDQGEDRGTRCPNCGFIIHVKEGENSGLLSFKIYRRRMRPLHDGEKIQVQGEAAFLKEACKRDWSVFEPVTPDVGTDYVIAKEYCAVMIQLKTSTVMEDRRYHVTTDKFQEGPLGFIVYYFVDDDTFFVIPSSEFWKIPRFKERKSKVFASGGYSDTLSYEKAKEVMGEYEGERGWERLERLTRLDGLVEAVSEFINEHKEE